MMNEKEQIAEILRQRGVLLPGDAVDLRVFNKLVTEPWLYNKSISYGFVSNPNLWDVDVEKNPEPIVKTEEPDVEPAKEVVEEQPEEQQEEQQEEQPTENQQVEPVEEAVVMSVEEPAKEVVEEHIVEKQATLKKTTSKKTTSKK